MLPYCNIGVKSLNHVNNWGKELGTQGTVPGLGRSGAKGGKAVRGPLAPYRGHGEYLLEGGEDVSTYITF